MIEFKEFPKIARLSREVIITEKIDGTNGCIFVGDAGEFLIGSRTRWITPEQDNHGFARWATEHKEELLQLGPGRYYGEWWGNGIQRGYGFSKGEKRFSLFNTIRWCLHDEEPKQIPTGDPRINKMQSVLPRCCFLVPVLYRGLFDVRDANEQLTKLRISGSVAAPGFMQPEGVVVYHIAGNISFKKTIGDDEHKNI